VLSNIENAKNKQDGTSSLYIWRTHVSSSNWHQEYRRPTLF